MHPLRHAGSFLTRVPLHRESEDDSDPSEAVPWFGVVGLILGLLQGGLYLLFREVSTPTLAAAVAMVLLALVTGVFHHDGLADAADAFWGGWTIDERLEILDDSRLGTYGVSALVFVILIEAAALSSLSGWVALFGTMAAHGLSRSIASFAMLTAIPEETTEASKATSFSMLVAPPAERESSLGLDYARNLSRSVVTRASLLIAISMFVFFGIVAIPIVIVAYFVGDMVVRLSISKIGGVNGDVLGAVQQVTKITTLITVVIAAEMIIEPSVTTGLGPLGGFAFA